MFREKIFFLFQKKMMWYCNSGVAKGAARLGAAFFDRVITLFFIVYCNKQLKY